MLIIQVEDVAAPCLRVTRRLRKHIQPQSDAEKARNHASPERHPCAPECPKCAALSSIINPAALLGDCLCTEERIVEAVRATEIRSEGQV